MSTEALLPEESPVAEETLDPQDWNELRALGHRMLDDMLDYMATLRDRPVWQPMPDEVRQSFRAELPIAGAPAGEVYDEFASCVLPDTMGNPHPRFWGWVMGGGTPLAMLADMLASAITPNLGGGDHSGNQVEWQVIEWLKELMGFPPEASGLLVSGGSMANLLGLAVARTARAGFDVRAEGLCGAPQPLVLYGSVEMHSSLQKAVETLGLGHKALRAIPVDAAYRIDTAALRSAIAADLAAGLRPICIVGCAGTVNSGAIDPLDELADIAAEYGLWYHIDGAFGAMGRLAPRAAALVKGVERADSLAFDLHKWGYLPFEVACLLVRDEAAHRDTFALHPAYLTQAGRGLAGGAPWFSDYGLQLTRGLRALKVWMAFKTYGTAQIGRVIDKNVNQARYLAGLVEVAPELELVAPVDLNIVCFRYHAPDRSEEQLNALNEELLVRLQLSGIAAPSGTTLRGRYALRCAITNHRSLRADFDVLVQAVTEIGRTLVAGGVKSAG
jgi:aromatic-L-amino-acid/L-tryptophan decarboxylase